MNLESLTLRNFRNVEESTLRADRHLNFLVGANGQGKTSFLEALSYIATLRSFRGAKTEEVVKWGSESSEISCVLTSAVAEPESPLWKTDLGVVFALSRSEHSGERKTRSSKVAIINGKPFRSSTQYLSQRFGAFELGFHSVIFNPSDHDIVRGEPSIRRSYLDRVLAAEDLEYLKVLQKYQRLLEQRNALFKQEIRPSRDHFLGFTEPLAQYAAVLTYKRLDWMERLLARLNGVVHQIAPNQPDLKAVYVSSWVPKIGNLCCSNNDLDSVHFAGQEDRPSLEKLEQAFWSQLSVLEEAEFKARTSLVGPHRDDWTFFLGNQVLKGHGSQGEVRSALLALKLCEIELFRKRTGHRPLLLLDDFSSELDRERRAFLLRFLLETDLQVFVTTTEDVFQVGKRYHVLNGKLDSSDGSQPVSQL
jgi:DNA replication and repair protein RecF